jgi:hypothetical protein
LNTLSRLSFLKSAGAAAGVAAVSASPVAAAIEPSQTETEPTGPVPREPVIAVVRDAGLGEVTVLSGTTEATYRDKLLVKRLMKAARRTTELGPKGVA